MVKHLIQIQRKSVTLLFIVYGYPLSKNSPSLVNTKPILHYFPDKIELILTVSNF
jgi:hypothetical protein